MLGDTSEFGPIDLLGGIAVNMGATKFALSKPPGELAETVTFGQ